METTEPETKTAESERKGWHMTDGQRKAAVARVESALVRGADDYFRKEGFVCIPSVPHIVSITGACENVDTLYSFDYHGRKAFLTQTGQTALEEMTCSLEKVCTTIHSFRKEEDVDDRHLTEFPLVEFEFRYEPQKEVGFTLLLNHIENTIYAMVKNALATERNSLLALGADVERLERLRTPFNRISYEEAIGYVGLEWEDDLKAVHERELLRRNDERPLFVTRYPKKIKFFNMQENRYDPRIVDSADLLLAPGGEAVGSAVREHDFEKLVKRLDTSEMMRNLRDNHGLDIENFDSYLSVVRDHGVPHAGCGIGLNRVMQYVLNEQDIRKVTPFPMNRETLY